MPPKTMDVAEATRLYNEVDYVYRHILDSNLLSEYDRAVTLNSLEKIQNSLMDIIRGKNIRYYEVSKQKGENEDEKLT